MFEQFYDAFTGIGYNDPDPAATAAYFGRGKAEEVEYDAPPIRVRKGTKKWRKRYSRR